MLQGGQELVCDGCGTPFSLGEPPAALCAVSQPALQPQAGHVGAFTPGDGCPRLYFQATVRHRDGFCFIEPNWGCEERPGR